MYTEKHLKMRAKIAFLLATFATILAGCDGRITVRPENIAVLYGTEVTMKCSTNSAQKLMWRMQRSFEVAKTIYTGSKPATDLPSYYRIPSNMTEDVHISIIANEFTAATYICEELGTQSQESASAELIALVSDPVCIERNEKYRVEATKNLPLQLFCHIPYWGHWAPVMEWKQITVNDNNTETSTSITKGVSPKSDNDSVESTLMVTGRQRLNGMRYTCTTRFTESNRPKSVTAKNTPEYSYTWKHPPERNKDEKEEQVEKNPVNLVVIIVVVLVAVLVVIVSGLIGYIVSMKRKKMKTKAEHNILAMDVISSTPRRTFLEESDYVEIGRASTVVDGSRCSGGLYVGLNAQEMARENFYAVLEDKQGCANGTKLMTDCQPDKKSMREKAKKI